MPTVLALHKGKLQPAVGYREADPDCDIDCVPNHARPAAVDVALSKSFAPGNLFACSLLLYSPKRASGKMIIFDGKEVVLHYEKRDSDFIIVSFIGLNHEHEADWMYLLRHLIVKENVNCLGFAVRQRNFFRSIEMEDALRVAASITTEFKTVILVGHSMGGYACIKYSKALKATDVIAVSPYFSINSGDLELYDDVQRRRVNYEVAAAKIVVSDLTKNMKIVPEDCQGRLFVIYNPQEEVDSYNARLINRVLPSVYMLPGYGIPHAIFDDLRVPYWFDRLNDCLRNAEESPLRGLRRLLYSEPDAIENIFIRACRKHPLYTLRFLISNRVRSLERYDLIAENDYITLKLYYFLHIEGHREKGLAYLFLVKKFGTGPTASQSFKAISDRIDHTTFEDKEDVLLVSIHGGVFSFDVETGRIKFFNSISLRAGIVPIRLRQKSGIARLIVPIAENLLELKFHAGQVGSAKRFQEHETLVATHQDGCVSILDPDGGFLSALPDSTVNTNSLVAGEWEKFAPLPLVKGGTNSLSSTFAVIDAQALAMAPSGPPSFAELENAQSVSIAPDAEDRSIARLTWFDKSRALAAFSDIKRSEAPRRRWWALFSRAR